MRLYTIAAGKMDEWVRGWTEGVDPLRVRFGFTVAGSWVTPEPNQFLWILRCDGPDDWEDKDRPYYDSPERRSLQPDPARLIVEQESWSVTTVVP